MLDRSVDARSFAGGRLHGRVPSGRPGLLPQLAATTRGVAGVSFRRNLVAKSWGLVVGRSLGSRCTRLIALRESGINALPQASDELTGGRCELVQGVKAA